MADDLDILTLDEAMAAISMTGSGAQHGEIIEQWVTAVSRRIDALCGPVVRRTVTETLDPTGSTLWPTYTPVYSISSITEYVGGSGTALTAETTSAAGTYLFRNGMISRRSGFYDTSWQGPVTIVYSAGRYADTASTDPLFKMAAGAILRRLWAREAPAWARGGDPFAGEGGGVGFFKVVDPAIDEFLGSQRLAPAIA